MAREHARLLVRINADRDFAELTPTEQWLFQRLTARPELNYAGVLPFDAKRWARMSKHITVEEIEVATWRLHEGRYLVVDDETDEVLIRSLLRNDEIAKQPNVLRSALRAAEFVESEALRLVLAEELHRVRPSAKEWQHPAIDSAIATLDPNGSGNPSPNPSANPVPEPSDNPSPNPADGGCAEPFVEPSATDPTVVVEVEGEGESVPVGRSLGGSRTRTDTREAAPRRPPAGPPPSSSPSTANGHAHPRQPCGRAHDPARNCAACGDARRAAEQAETDAEAAQRAERAAAAEARRQCRACSETGWLEHPESGRPMVRCDHETDPRQQLADAMDQAS